MATICNVEAEAFKDDDEDADGETEFVARLDTFLRPRPKAGSISVLMMSGSQANFPATMSCFYRKLISWR